MARATTPKKRNAKAAATADQPSEGAILERAMSLTNQAMFTVTLQHRRVRSAEPEDKVFILRWVADLQFLIVALRRLRRSAQVAIHAPSTKARIEEALAQFDQSVAGLAKMRNVGEHVSDYAIDSPRRHHPEVTRRALQVGTWDDPVYTWLGAQLNIDDAKTAAERLFVAVRDAVAAYPRKR